MKKRILILWGTDGFGKWTAIFILQHFWEHAHVIVTWRNTEKWTAVSKELWVTFTDDNNEYIREADIVIFSVPIGFMEDSIKELAPKIKSWTIVLDVCSVKTMPSEALKKYCHPDCCIIPTHPMFGPYVSSIAGQIFVLTPDTETKNSPSYIALKQFLDSKSAKIIEISALEHDKMMAVVQWLTHFDMFVFWETIRRLNFDIHESLNLVSPVYKMIISSVARYLDQNPKLYSDIQIHNPEVLEVHKTFMEVTEHYNNIVKSKDEQAFIETAEASKDFFWEENTKSWQRYTDKIIYLIWKQVEIAKQNVGKEVYIRNIYTKKEILWVLKWFENDMLIFENNESYHIDEWEILENT